MNPMMPAPQPTGGYNFPQAPAAVTAIPPALSGGYYNQMAQMMAGPNYQMPHFKFTGLNAIGPGMGNGSPTNAPFQQQPTGPASGIGTGMGPYAFGGAGNGQLGGLLAGGGNDGGFPTNLTLGGGNVTGGYSPPSSSSGLTGILASVLGGAALGGPGALLGQAAAKFFGGSNSDTGGLTLPNGQTLPTQNMNLPPTSIPMPMQNINLAQPIINPDTGMPYGTAYGETPQGAQALATEQAFANQANSFTQEAMNPALWGGRHLRL